MNKKLFALALLLILSLSLASCGGSSANKLDITMTEFKYTPNEGSVTAGQEISLNVTNDGAVLHEYVIMKLGQTAGDKFGPEDEDNIYWEVEVEPGQNVSTTFTAPSEPGVYEIVCGTEGHLEAGMKGTLTVVAAQ